MTPDQRIRFPYQSDIHEPVISVYDEFKNQVMNRLRVVGFLDQNDVLVGMPNQTSRFEDYVVVPDVALVDAQARNAFQVNGVYFTPSIILACPPHLRTGATTLEISSDRGRLTSEEFSRRFTLVDSTDRHLTLHLEQIVRGAVPFPLPQLRRTTRRSYFELYKGSSQRTRMSRQATDAIHLGEDHGGTTERALLVVVAPWLPKKVLLARLSLPANWRGEVVVNGKVIDLSTERVSEKVLTARSDHEIQPIPPLTQEEKELAVLIEENPVAAFNAIREKLRTFPPADGSNYTYRLSREAEMYSKDSGNKRRVYIQDSGDKVALDVVDMSQEEEEIFLSACQQTVPSKEALVGKAVRGDRKVRIEIGAEKDKMFATVAPLILDHRSKQIQDPARKVAMTKEALAVIVHSLEKPRDRQQTVVFPSNDGEIMPAPSRSRWEELDPRSRKRIEASKRGQENAARVHTLLDELGQSVLDKGKGASQKKPHKRRGQQQTP